MGKKNGEKIKLMKEVREMKGNLFNNFFIACINPLTRKLTKERK